MRTPSTALDALNAETLKARLEPWTGRRVLILGIGNTLKADDGVGPLICTGIEGNVQAKVLDAGTVPENYIHTIMDYDPALLLILDAVFLGKGYAPGCFTLISPTEIGTGSFSTHSAPVSLLLQALRASCACEAWVLCIQPQCLTLGGGMSPVVKEATQTIAKVLCAVFQ